MVHQTQNSPEELSLPPATIDYESRSAADINKVGSWKYSLDPSTEILCLVYRLPYWPEGRTALWHPAFPDLNLAECALCTQEERDALPELFTWVNEGHLIEAHNAFFERGIWLNIQVPQFGWPAIPAHQWRCSAAKAAACALPRKLEMAGLALRLKIQKDLDGHKVMLKMSKPRKPRKKEVEAWKKVHGRKPMPKLWHRDLGLLQRLFAYCRQDVLAEELLSHSIPDLSPDEVQMYLLDQTINQRGFQLDPLAVSSALRLIAAEVKLLNAELTKLTNGQVEKATQRARMIKWFGAQGLTLINTQKATLDSLLSEEDPTTLTMSSKARRGLELVRTLGRSSTAKYETMRQQGCSDWRVRGGLLYHGATTGRWSGKGVQPHNFVKGGIKNMEEAWDLIKTEDRQAIMHYVADAKDHPTVTMGEVMKMLAEALRGAIISSPGMNLYVADFASIEARVLLWLAKDESGLEIFRKRQDIYMDMATSTYGYPVTDKKKQADERALGKVAILGLGYQMGAGKFVDTAWTMGKIRLPEDLPCDICEYESRHHRDMDDDHAYVHVGTEMSAVRVVDAYRAKYHKVVAMWKAQEAAAMSAVARPGVTVREGRMSWKVEGIFLFCTLPSGRRLSYPYPQLKMKHTPWGTEQIGLTFMGVNPNTHQWERLTTYGGMIVENQTQAVARDLMAVGMMRAERTGVYEIILSVHDELIAEAHPAWADVQEFERLMAKTPPWAKGCPVEAEGWTGKRYKK